MTASRILLFFLLAGFITLPATAEYYKYIDENGNLIFTDDLSKVPLEQRENLKIYEEFSPEPILESVKTETIKKAPLKKGEKTKIDTLQQKLLNEKDELDKTLKSLLERRKALAEEQKKANSIDAIKTFNQKILQFKEESMAFNKKKSAYEKKLSEFNQMLENIPPPENEVKK